MRKLIGAAAMIIIASVLFAACEATEPATEETTEFVEETVVLEETAPVEESTDLVYENSNYGFSMTFPETWEGYKVEELSDIELSFKVNSESVFTVLVYTNEKWNELVTANDGPLPFELDSNDEYTFTYSGNQGAQDEKVRELQNELEDIVNTFELK